jgi:hypothetical protein
MKLFLHTDLINERGVAASTFEYAIYLQSLGHQVSWFYNINYPGNDSKVINNYGKLVEIRGYKDFNKEQLQLSKEFDWAYFQKQGSRDGLAIDNIPNNVHAVFNVFEPHGNHYAYISKWLSSHAGRSSNSPNRYLAGIRRRIPNPLSRNSFVPYCVDLPRLEEDCRNEWGVPQEAFVCLTMGGEFSFDIQWVQKTIIQTLHDRSDFYFVAFNTKPFVSHNRAIFLKKITNKADKVRVLKSANVFLHGRTIGETFGMAILEAMAVGTPILSWKGGRDRNHISLLDRECLYRDHNDLRSKLKNLPSKKSVQNNLKTAEAYQTVNVMPRFMKVFELDEIK